MFESSKSNQYRDPEFFSKYMSGSVIDIGCGPDPVVPHARPFDLIHGDASRIGEYLSDQSFDTVYSSHCLEHMPDVEEALMGWWRLVKPGGHMIVVVPHEDLYEQGFWPSLYNRDHKATFRLAGNGSWSPISYNVPDLVEGLPGCEVVSIELQDHGLRHAWRPPTPSKARRLGALGKFFSRLRHSILKRVRRKKPELFEPVANIMNTSLARLGIPVDQTHFGALAQIQFILYKQEGTR